MPCVAAERRVVFAQLDEALMRIGVRGLGIIVSGDFNHAWEDKRWKAMKRRLGLVDVGENEDLVTFIPPVMKTIQIGQNIVFTGNE